VQTRNADASSGTQYCADRPAADAPASFFALPNTSRSPLSGIRAS